MTKHINKLNEIIQLTTNISEDHEKISFNFIDSVYVNFLNIKLRIGNGFEQ